MTYSVKHTYTTVSIDFFASLLSIRDVSHCLQDRYSLYFYLFYEMYLIICKTGLFSLKWRWLKQIIRL